MATADAGIVEPFVLVRGAVPRDLQQATFARPRGALEHQSAALELLIGISRLVGPRLCHPLVEPLRSSVVATGCDRCDVAGLLDGNPLLTEVLEDLVVGLVLRGELGLLVPRLGHRVLDALLVLLLELGGLAHRHRIGTDAHVRDQFLGELGASKVIHEVGRLHDDVSPAHVLGVGHLLLHVVDKFEGVVLFPRLDAGLRVEIADHRIRNAHVLDGAAVGVTLQERPHRHRRAAVQLGRFGAVHDVGQRFAQLVGRICRAHVTEQANPLHRAVRQADHEHPVHGRLEHAFRHLGRVVVVLPWRHQLGRLFCQDRSSFHGAHHRPARQGRLDDTGRGIADDAGGGLLLQRFGDRALRHDLRRDAQNLGLESIELRADHVGEDARRQGSNLRRSFGHRLPILRGHALQVQVRVTRGDFGHVGHGAGAERCRAADHRARDSADTSRSSTHSSAHRGTPKARRQPPLHGVIQIAHHEARDVAHRGRAGRVADRNGSQLPVVPSDLRLDGGLVTRQPQVSRLQLNPGAAALIGDVGFLGPGLDRVRFKQCRPRHERRGKRTGRHGCHRDER